MTEKIDHRGKWPQLQIYARTGLWIAIIISFAWTVLIVLAPLTIPPGSVTGLDGRANIIEYGEIWATLPPVQRIIYYLGDIECHQIESRTIILNHNEMPVCSRDASLFFFITIGLMLAAVVRPNLAVSKAIVRMLPAKLRNRIDRGRLPLVFTWLLGLLMLAPAIIDGGAQLATSYESTNVIRFITGVPAGVFLGLIIGLLIQSIHLLPSSRKIAQSQ